MKKKLSGFSEPTSKLLPFFCTSSCHILNTGTLGLPNYPETSAIASPHRVVPASSLSSDLAKFPSSLGILYRVSSPPTRLYPYQLPPHPALKFAPPNSTASISSSDQAILPNLFGNSLRSHTSPFPAFGSTAPSSCPECPPMPP